MPSNLPDHADKFELRKDVNLDVMADNSEDSIDVYVRYEYIHFLYLLMQSM